MKPAFVVRYTGHIDLAIFSGMITCATCPHFLSGDVALRYFI